MKDQKDFRLEELGNTYAGPEDRFIVSLIVGYRDDEGYLPQTPAQAVAAALELTQDEGSSGTHWHCYDRKTKTLHLILQSEAENAHMKSDEDEDK